MSNFIFSHFRVKLAHIGLVLDVVRGHPVGITQQEPGYSEPGEGAEAGTLSSRHEQRLCPEKQGAFWEGG